MPYPNLDQYQSAVQNPVAAFRDPDLRRGEIGKDSLGIPEAYGGGFAYTYSLKSAGKDFAVRCFKGENKKRQQHYDVISRWMKATPRPYWVPFDYQAAGITVNGSTYPIVKMDWAKGSSLGEYIFQYHADATKMRTLRDQFAQLAADFERLGCAHGDLQNGNILVSNRGSLILIDYDGMYVPGIPQGAGDEIGIAHFQHPARTARLFGPKMDRFSFAIIWLSLESLARKPELYDTYGSGQNIIFSASDYTNWNTSPLVCELHAIKDLAPLVARAGRICEITPEELPPLAEFLDTSKPIAGTIVAATTVAPILVPIFDALAYDDIRKHIGERVEVRGEITEVYFGSSANTQRQYVLISFTTRWRGPQFRIAIWNRVLPKMQRKPDRNWVGKYVSISGLVDPEYQYVYMGSSYPRLGITIQEESQLRFINRPTVRHVVAKTSPMANTDIMKKLTRPAAPVKLPAAPVKLSTSVNTANTPSSKGSSTPPPNANRSEPSGCFVATAVFQDVECQPVAQLRLYRDEVLTRSVSGRWFIRKYNLYGPFLAKYVSAHAWMRSMLKPILSLLASLASMYVTSSRSR